MERTERIQQQLASNNLQLHSFLERLCLENGSPTPSDYNDVETAIQGGSILETETIATVRSISAETMGPLLQAIAESPELVLLKVVDIQPQRGEPGRFNLRITVSTFRANQQQQEDS
ncbi:MAG: hypothetical protein KC561_12855, partial [Myxococcales bacterium]|nr:hypothetical protein [Myxococcales bacterium]